MCVLMNVYNCGIPVPCKYYMVRHLKIHNILENIPFNWGFTIIILVSQHNISNIFYQRLMSYYVICCLKALHKTDTISLLQGTMMSHSMLKWQKASSKVSVKNIVILGKQNAQFTKFQAVCLMSGFLSDLLINVRWIIKPHSGNC